MPVYFARGDLFSFNVDAIVIPHAPNDRMPWCNYDEKDFWDITLDVFSRADMKTLADKYYIFRGNGYKIGEEFIEEGDIREGRMVFIPEKYPTVTVTQFSGLPVKYVFHVCVHSYTEYICKSDDYSFCAEREKYMLSRCYWMALNCAAKKGVRRIAFPLFSTDCPKEIAYEAAHSVPQKWIAENTKDIPNDPSHEKTYKGLVNMATRHDAEMQIYIVEPNREDMLRMEALRKDPSAYRPFLSEFEQRLEREKSAFHGGANAFKSDFITKCFDNYKNRGGKFSDIIALTGFTTLYKFKKDPSKCPHEHRLIAAAVVMGLNDYERFVFVRCGGYENYPEEERDFLVEKLISEGKRDFKELNEALIEADPSYALDAEVKKKKKKKKKGGSR